MAAQFGHKRNKDGTVSSVCEHCYVTVGTATFEADLKHAETAHKCDQARVKQFELPQRNEFRTMWVQPTKPD